MIIKALKDLTLTNGTKVKKGQTASVDDEEGRKLVEGQQAEEEAEKKTQKKEKK